MPKTPIQSPVRVLPPLAPIKHNRSVSRTRAIPFPLEEQEELYMQSIPFHQFLHCEEESLVPFYLPTLPPLKPYFYKIEFVTMNTPSKKVLRLPFYLNDHFVTNAFLEMIDDSQSTNLQYYERTWLLFRVLTGLSYEEGVKEREIALNDLQSHPVFWKLHYLFGLEFLKSIVVRTVHLDSTEVPLVRSVPLKESDKILCKGN